MTSKTVHVAVGVIVNQDKQILIALRPEESHQGGLWEFPGGKVEKDETLEQALDRELTEELGLSVNSCRPLIKIQHDYSDKSVLLDVWWVEDYDFQLTGSSTGKEGQEIRWVSVEKIHEYQFPEANKPIVSAIQEALLVIPE